jgi:hypothetical protein
MPVHTHHLFGTSNQPHAHALSMSTGAFFLQILGNPAICAQVEEGGASNPGGHGGRSIANLERVVHDEAGRMTLTKGHSFSHPGPCLYCCYCVLVDISCH